MVRKKISYAICLLSLSAILFCGCSGDQKEPNDSFPGKTDSDFASSKNAAQDSPNQEPNASNEEASKSGPPRDNAPQALRPEASGTAAYGNDLVTVDASHADNGYFMVRYQGENPKVKLKVTGPNQSEYIYLLSGSGEFETFPLPCGSGGYQIQVLENAGGDMYATAFSTEISAAIEDEFSPFLYPNQYVNFTESSLAVAKGSELAEGVYSDLEAIENIYHFVTEEITYDEEKAESVSYGYLPDIDETLSSKKGICFDYASLMCAMLRTQRIPTKLEVGYSGEAYHAWISAYTAEKGWVDGIIQFDGKSWKLLDPTLAANNSSSSVKKYIGDASNYVVKYSY